MVDRKSDDDLKTKLLETSQDLFQSQGMPPPSYVELRNRSWTLTKPKMSPDGTTIVILRGRKKSQYGPQISWALAHYVLRKTTRFFTRYGSKLEMLLALVLLLDMTMVLFAPYYLDRVLGFVLFGVVQFLCIMFSWQIIKGKASQAELIANVMVSTGSWTTDRAQTHTEPRTGFRFSLPSIGVAVVTGVGWVLYFL